MAPVEAVVVAALEVGVAVEVVVEPAPERVAAVLEPVLARGPVLGPAMQPPLFLLCASKFLT